jgi:hypothetical protein
LLSSLFSTAGRKSAVRLCLMSRRRVAVYHAALQRPVKPFPQCILFPRSYGCLRILSWFVLVGGWEPSMTVLVRFWTNHSTATRRNRSQAIGFIFAVFIKPTLYEVLTGSTAWRCESIAPLAAFIEPILYEVLTGSTAWRCESIAPLGPILFRF